MQEPPQTAGWLALVATPIGNLDDITLRALETLRQADVIAAEDTRRARQLLSRFEIQPGQLISYHAHNEHKKTAHLLQMVQNGQKLAVVSDAGTPCISDPGYLLVRDAVGAGIEPVVIPGVSALTHAAVAAGLPVSTFTFAGFLPPKGAKRSKRIDELLAAAPTLVLYESPHRVGRLLQDIIDAVGGEVRVVILREATKLHEECLRGTAAELLAAHGSRTWKGEVTVVVSLTA